MIIYYEVITTIIKSTHNTHNNDSNMNLYGIVSCCTKILLLWLGEQTTSNNPAPFASKGWWTNNNRDSCLRAQPASQPAKPSLQKPHCSSYHTAAVLYLGLLVTAFLSSPLPLPIYNLISLFIATIFRYFLFILSYSLLQQLALFHFRCPRILASFSFAHSSTPRFLRRTAGKMGLLVLSLFNHLP